MASSPARGSHKLLSELIKKGAAATAEEVKAAVSVPAAAELKLLNWLIRGLPPIYYEVETVFQAQPAQVSAAVNGFLSNASIRNVNILINGLPAFDSAVINAVFGIHGPGGPVGPGGQ